MENSTLQQYEPELNNSSLSIERTYPTPLLYKQCNLIDLRLVCAWSAPGTRPVGEFLSNYLLPTFKYICKRVLR